MTDELPDYTTIEPPDGKPVEEYSYHERRAELLQRIREAGSPFAINQSQEADRFDVHESTISRDMDRLRESVGARIGNDAKLTTSVLFEEIVTELLGADDWRAKKAAWDVVMDWNEWLADLGEQHREPDRVEADVRQRTSEVQYRIVREETDLPTGDDSAGIDFEALGFAEGPAGIDVEAVDEVENDR